MERIFELLTTVALHGLIALVASSVLGMLIVGLVVLLDLRRAPADKPAPGKRNAENGTLASQAWGERLIACLDQAAVRLETVRAARRER